MNKVDYYEILGVHRDADNKELKRAYRRLAMQYHPDRNPEDQDAEVKFKATAEAYQVLSDPDQRSLYDIFGHDGLNQRPAPSAGFASVDDIFAQFNDLFGDIFDFGASPAAPSSKQSPNKKKTPRKGIDLKTELDISFVDAVFGTQSLIEFERQDLCTTCDGSGDAASQERIPCTRCHGEGEVKLSQGFFSVTTPCSLCGGKGYDIQEECGTCGGVGALFEQLTKKIRIPAGINDGARLRLPKQGNLRPGQEERGDLFVTVHVQESEVFERDGLNLHYRARIPFVLATLGCQIEVPTLSDVTTVTLPAGTQFGDIHKLEGAGITHTNKRRSGNILVHCVVETPQNLGARELGLFKDLAASMSYNLDSPLPSPHEPLRHSQEEE